MPASAKLLHRYASPIAAIVSPRRYCAARTAASPIRSADRHHRIAAFALLALRLTYIRILSSIAVAYCVTAVFYTACCAVMLLRYPLALLFNDPPSRQRCSLRSSRRYNDDLSERKLCHTAPSRYVLPLRFSTMARHLTRYRLIATLAH